MLVIGVLMLVTYLLIPFFLLVIFGEENVHHKGFLSSIPIVISLYVLYVKTSKDTLRFGIVSILCAIFAEICKSSDSAEIALLCAWISLTFAITSDHSLKKIR